MQNSSSTLNPDQWISQYYSYLFNYANSRVAYSYVVEELIQETFFSALKAMKNFENRASERTWLTAILRHKIINHYRNRNTVKGEIEKRMISNEEYKEIYNRELSEDVYFGNDGYNQDSYTELCGIVMTDIGRLPKRQAEVFTMRVIHGYETEVICEKLNITRENVWVLMSRAKRNLSNSLGKTFWS